MKKSILAIIIASTVLAGCSSNGSNDGTSTNPGFERDPDSEIIDPGEGTPGTPPTGEDDHGLEPIDPPESDNDIATGEVKWEVTAKNDDYIQINEINGDRYVQVVMNPDGTIIIQDQDGHRIERPDAGWGFVDWNGDNGWGASNDRNPGTDPIDPGEGTPGTPPTGDDDHGLEPIVPGEGTPELPIYEAQIKLENGGWITADGEPIARTYYYNNAGIPTITVEGINGHHEVKITKHPHGDQVSMFVNGELVKVAGIDDIQARLDNGWGASNDRNPGTDPIDPGEGTPGTPPTGEDDHGLEPLDPPELNINQTISASLDGDTLVITLDGQSITTDYTVADDGRGNVTIYDRHGAIKGEGQIIDGQLVFGNGIVVDDRGNITIPTQDANSALQLTSEQQSELRNKAKSLSLEQRQQIKQAIKTKLQSRS